MAQNADGEIAEVGIKLDVMELINKTIELSIKVYALETENEAKDRYWLERIAEEKALVKKLTKRVKELEST